MDFSNLSINLLYQIMLEEVLTLTVLAGTLVMVVKMKDKLLTIPSRESMIHVYGFPLFGGTFECIVHLGVALESMPLI